jgi:hypothetical protein
MPRCLPPRNDGSVAKRIPSYVVSSRTAHLVVADDMSIRIARAIKATPGLIECEKRVASLE